MRNNVFHDQCAVTGYGDALINMSEFPTGVGFGMINGDYNIFYFDANTDASSKVLVRVGYYDDDPVLSEWQAQSGNDVDSLFADPLLNVTIDTDDLDTSLTNGFGSLDETSPGINAGDPNREYTRFDFFGDRRSDQTLGAIGG